MQNKSLLNKSLIIQSDMTILADVHVQDYEIIRDELSKFAELHKSPEHMHIYRITPISLWNASALGMTINDIKMIFESYSKYEIPDNIYIEIEKFLNRYGIIELSQYENDNKSIVITINDKYVLYEIENIKNIYKHFHKKIENNKFIIKTFDRGTIKQKLIDLGYPIKDNAGFIDGDKLEIRKRKITKSGIEFKIRDYQNEASDFFLQKNNKEGNYGVVVLPCGSGKTIVGINIMEEISQKTLILCPNVSAVHQWIREILDKTNIDSSLIGEYTGEKKEIKPITVSTYQILVYRKNKKENYPHFDIFNMNNWGLIIYDEVHLLPAPIFRVTAEIQSRRRLGLTATLVREDGNEKYVFSLIGPKRYDIPWKELEKKGYIAKAFCHEIRVTFNEADRLNYITSKKRSKLRLAAENSLKINVVKYLIAKHSNEQILIIGQYISQLKSIQKILNVDIITGSTSNKIRDSLYEKFRMRDINILIVSKVANFAIDLPDASVAIQISGTYGSRQEEAQRLGRILRPKNKNSFFYSIITKDSLEQDYAMNRQLFLTEQGYNYYINEWDN